MTNPVEGVTAVEDTDLFEAERPRLLAIASRVLGDHAEAQDVVQQAWLRWHGTDTEIDNLPAWLTTVTTRLCLDRLRSRTPVPVDDLGPGDAVSDPADDVALAETVGLALHVVLDRLSPRERVAFVLHDSFGFEFPTIAAVLDTTPAAARKLASRARAKVGQPHSEDRLADWEVVDAFMAAAKGGDFDQLLRLLAPDATVTADDAAVAVGTPSQLEGRDRWRCSSTAAHTPRSRSSWGTAPAPPGSTSVWPRSSSTSPSEVARCAPSPSVPHPTCSRRSCAATPVSRAHDAVTPLPFPIVTTAGPTTRRR